MRLEPPPVDVDVAPADAHARQALAPGSDRARGERRPMAAGRVLAAMLVMLLVWGLLDARSLHRSAEADRSGARRTVAMAVTGALFTLSRVTLIDRVGSFVERSLGRDPDAAPGGSAPVVIGPPPAPVITPSGAESGRSPSPRATSPSVAPTSDVKPVLPPLRRPTVADPLRVVVMGDSFAADLGIGLGRELGPKFSIVIDGRQSTGLTRPDYFNWFSEAQADVAKYHPELVVAMFGGNDFQNVIFSNGTSISYFRHPDEWQAAYRRRTDRLMDETTIGGARVLWVGLPIMGTTPGLNGEVRLVNRIFSEEARPRPQILYVDTWHLFVDRSGNYQAYLPDQHGDVQLMRTPDRIHLTLPGNEYLASYLVDVLQEQWGLRP